MLTLSWGYEKTIKEILPDNKKDKNFTRLER
jgi:hypothetical protein